MPPVQGVRHAGFMVRFAAFVFDSIIVSGGGVLLVFLVTYLGSGSAGLVWENLTHEPVYDGLAPGSEVVAYLVGVVIGSLVMLLYFPLFEGLVGATPGKLLMGITVVDVTTAAPIGFSRAFTRYLGKIINNLSLGLLWLMVAFREDRRGLHDLMARSVVVQRSSLAGLRGHSDGAAAGGGAQ